MTTIVPEDEQDDREQVEARSSTVRSPPLV
jgi:hypothetical protein